VSSFRIEKTRTDNKIDVSPHADISTSGCQTQSGGSKLPDLFSSAGLEEIEPDVRDAAPHLAIAMHV
jgi:hypothetical protein